MAQIEVFGKTFDTPDTASYQQIFGVSDSHGRDSEERILDILSADTAYNNGVLKTSGICDVGCNLGWIIMKLESLGIGRSWIGVDFHDRLIKIAEHISYTNKLTASFVCTDFMLKPLPKVSAYLFLSVLHHWMDFSGYEKLRTVFDAIEETANTIYIEQATNLEDHPWAIKMRPPGSSIPAFYWKEKLEEFFGNKYTIRLVGTTKTSTIAIRYLYLLKKKLSERITVRQEAYTVLDIWRKPYIGSGCVDKAFYKLEDKQGNVYFGKRKISESIDQIEICSWFEGVLLIDAFRWGLIPFLDKSKILSGFLNMATPDLSGDSRPWNFMVNQYSDIIRIDRTPQRSDPVLEKALLDVFIEFFRSNT